MSCLAIEENVLERYVLGRASEEEQAAFERHYFECADCLGDVQTLQAVQETLLERVRRQRSVRRWVPLAAAVAAGAAGITLLTHAGSNSRARAVTASARPAASSVTIASSRQVRLSADLLRVEPPAYTSLTMRGAEGRPRWRAAMNRYQSGDYSGAATLLREAHRDASSPAEDFYLGVCELVAERNAEAAALLASVAGSGDPVYSGPASFYLGKAELRLGRVEEARRTLQRLAATDGPAAEPARRLVALIPQSAR